MSSLLLSFSSPFLLPQIRRPTVCQVFSGSQKYVGEPNKFFLKEFSFSLSKEWMRWLLWLKGPWIGWHLAITWFGSSIFLIPFLNSAFSAQLYSQSGLPFMVARWQQSQTHCLQTRPGGHFHHLGEGGGGISCTKSNKLRGREGMDARKEKQ